MESSHVHISTNNFKENDGTLMRKDDLSSVDSKSGLLSIRAIIFLLLWYLFSGCTLFLNKYILTYLNGNPTVLGKCYLRFKCLLNVIDFQELVRC